MLVRFYDELDRIIVGRPISLPNQYALYEFRAFHCLIEMGDV